MIKVKFLKSPTGQPYFLGYFQGDTASISTSIAEKLIKSGIAQKIDGGDVIEEKTVVVENKMSNKPTKSIKR